MGFIDRGLVVIRFGGSHYGAPDQYGSVIVLDPASGGSYKMYTHNDAKWRENQNIFYLCGGFWWKHKLFLYDESYSKYEFELKELKD